MPSTLWAAGFFTALVAPLAPLIVLGVRGFRGQIRTRRSAVWSVLLLATLAAHPVVQLGFLEELDSRVGNRLDREAQDAGLVGMAPQQVRALLGEPDYQWSEAPRILDSEGRTVRELDPYTAWEYQQVPGYWLGSHFQVFFKKGIVSNFEANDD